MTYPTRYEGQLTIEPPLNRREVRALTAFFHSRRIQTLGGPLDTRPLGANHQDVIDYNLPPEGQPGLHCDLEISEKGDVLCWGSAMESQANLDKWITYVIDHLLKEGGEFDIRERNFDLTGMSDEDLLRYFTFDHEVNGHMTATATETGEVWKILVKENKVFVEDVRLIIAAEADEDDDVDD